MWIRNWVTDYPLFLRQTRAQRGEIRRSDFTAETRDRCRVSRLSHLHNRFLKEGVGRQVLRGRTLGDIPLQTLSNEVAERLRPIRRVERGDRPFFHFFHQLPIIPHKKCHIGEGGTLLVWTLSLGEFDRGDSQRPNVALQAAMTLQQLRRHPSECPAEIAFRRDGVIQAS